MASCQAPPKQVPRTIDNTRVADDTIVEPEDHEVRWTLSFSVFYFFYNFYNNFICNNQYKKAAIREELNPHVRWPPKNIYEAIKEI